MLKETFSNIFNTKSETVNNAIITLGNIDDTGKGKHFVSRFIQAGLVKIEGHGIVLLKKETIDQSLQSMVGAPVIIKHQDVTEDNADELRCGVISRAYFNEDDGWYYAEGIIWDEKAQELINNKDWSVSCSYDFLSYNDDGGVENNIKYDKEFTQLNFTHLALVNNPRYERANIVFNSKDEENGRWVTIKGSHIFIKDGETLGDAMKRNGWGKKSDFRQKKLSKVKEDIETEIQKLYGDDEDLMEYFSVNTETKEKYYDDESDMSVVEVRAELGYDDMVKLAEKLDKIVQKYDKDAYFDQEEAGIMTASVNFDRNKPASKDKLPDASDKSDGKEETKSQVIEKAYKSLDTNDFIPKNQKFSIKHTLQGSEYKHFADKIAEIEETIKHAPKMYETDGVKLEDKKPILHYFGGNYDNYVYEIDKETGHMFGAVNMGYGYELGYSSMQEINSVPFIELDLYFDGEQPKELRGSNVGNAKDEKEIEMTLMDEIKKLISKVENNKENEEMIENEKTDKRKLIDEVAGIMKSAGCDDEDIRTAIGKMEKIGYDASEDSKADNKKVKNEEDEEDKKVENEDEEDKEKAKDIKEDVKEDVENKCKNSKSSFDKINEIYNSVKTLKEGNSQYISREDKLKAGVEYFS